MPAGRDPHDNTFETTFTEAVLINMAKACLASSDHLLMRDWAMEVWQCAVIGRGEDVRERRMSELVQPKLLDTISERASWGADAGGVGRVRRQSRETRLCPIARYTRGGLLLKTCPHWRRAHAQTRPAAQVAS